MRANPLEFLGIPKFLVVREYDQGRSASVLKLAEALFKTYTNVYHPDRPDGDADFMASFAEAISLLRNEVSLEMYIEEYINGTVRQQASTQRADSAVRERDKRAFTALANSLSVVNQWDVLATDKPVTLFTTDGRTRHILDVVSPSLCEVRVVPAQNEQLPMEEDKLEYRNGIWSELYVINDKVRRKQHNDLLRLSDARIVGSVPHSALNAYDSEAGVDRSHSSGMLGAGGVDAKLGFTEPQYAWYLSALVPECPEGNNVVFWAHGKVALGTVVRQIKVIQ